jgi:hypothetical protein
MAFIPNAQRSRAADAVTARANNGRLRIYSGTVPADANAALSGNTLLADLPFGATAFGAAASGVATANAITTDSSADATGTATFFRVLESDLTTVVFQGTVGTSGAELNLSSVSVIAGGPVSVSALTYTQAASS